MKLHGCHNRPAFQKTLSVQNGWTPDGRRIQKEIIFRMERRCMYDLKKTDEGCKGCRWQTLDE
jgi:hypothetical protein